MLLVLADDLLQRCQSGERQAQRQVYDQVAPLILGICRRYLRDPAEAEDAMIRSLQKGLTRLPELRDRKTFLGWLKRIAINECLMQLRKNRPQGDDLELSFMADSRPDAIDALAAQDILKLLEALPSGYRTVFNLYVLEGYTHREIADLLGISINTSKSQLIQARRKLAAWLHNRQSSMS